MTTADLPAPSAEPSGAPSRRARAVRIGLGVLAGLVVALVAVVVVGTYAFHAAEDRPLPTFPSLAAHPDPSLGGTVAYYDDRSRCVRLVAAAGRPSRQLWCLPEEGPETWTKVGKPVGPQLVWLPDGRLEITMFRMTPAPDTKSAPPLGPGWQKIVDVRTGAVEDVPADRLPSAPNQSTQPTRNPAGERIRVESDAMTGKTTVALRTADGTRTLLSVHGPGEYTYRFGPAFWAPSWQWIAASDDGRILVITPSRPPRTRILVTGSGGGAGGGTAGPTFAVTAEDLLAEDG